MWQTLVQGFGKIHHGGTRVGQNTFIITMVDMCVRESRKTFFIVKVWITYTSPYLRELCCFYCKLAFVYLTKMSLYNLLIFENILLPNFS